MSGEFELFAGSGFLTQRDMYRIGGLMTACQMGLYLLVGTPWLMLIWR